MLCCASNYRYAEKGVKELELAESYQVAAMRHGVMNRRQSSQGRGGKFFGKSKKRESLILACKSFVFVCSHGPGWLVMHIFSTFCRRAYVAGGETLAGLGGGSAGGENNNASRMVGDFVEEANDEHQGQQAKDGIDIVPLPKQRRRSAAQAVSVQSRL